MSRRREVRWLLARHLVTVDGSICAIVNVSVGDLDVKPHQVGWVEAEYLATSQLSHPCQIGGFHRIHKLQRTLEMIRIEPSRDFLWLSKALHPPGEVSLPRIIYYGTRHKYSAARTSNAMSSTESLNSALAYYRNSSTQIRNRMQIL